MFRAFVTGPFSVGSMPRRRFEEISRAPGDGTLELLESLTYIVRHFPASDVGHDLVKRSLKAFQIQAEFVEPLSDLGLDHRHGMTGVDHRHHESMSLEEPLDLGVICGLAGTGHVADHRKDRTLDHGAEEYIRTQREWIGLGALAYGLRRHGLTRATKLEVVPVPVDPLPSFGTLQEEIDRTVQDGHLRGIAGAFEVVRILAEQRLMRLGSIELLEEEWSRELLDGGRGRVGEAHTEWCQQAGKNPGESVSKGRPRLVGLAKLVDEGSAEICRGKGLHGLLDQIHDLHTEWDTVQSPAGVSGILHLKTDQLVFRVDDIRVVCLIPVMIL